MTIEAIASLAADSISSIASGLTETAPTTQTNQTTQTDFGQWMNAQVSDVNAQINSSQMDLAHLATGETGNLHHVMLELEKAKLGFQLTLQVRNKILEGYQDIMRMQI